ncbi:MAG TPA: C39 family peptidase [Roseiflexaceae bacterium]|nr:C39 family peptidase [Roseiflexaceae bacterium]
MAFPAYVHSVVSSSDSAAWPVEAQGFNQCGCTAASNALNLLMHTLRFRKDDFVHKAGLLYQPKLGGTPSPVTTWLIQRNGFGTHFGNLQKTDYEQVLRDLIDRGIPVIIELGVVKVGSLAVSGQHSVVLVGYSDPFRDISGQVREEYYLVDAQWPQLGSISLSSNDRDADGDGVVELFPGNRTLTRQELGDNYPMRTYFPVFPTQSDHDAWYRQNIRSAGGIPLLSTLAGRLVTGSNDIWVGPRRQLTPQPSPAGLEIERGQ